MRPTVHLNGTSRKELLEQLTEALERLRRAEGALMAAAPNGRDYYTQGNMKIVEASAQHSLRMKALKVIYAELEEIAEGLVQ
jgi:hypothetical protein